MPKGVIRDYSERILTPRSYPPGALSPWGLEGALDGGGPLREPVREEALRLVLMLLLMLFVISMLMSLSMPMSM